MKSKVLVIGLDGATWDLIKPLIKEGKLPTFRKLIESGAYGDFESTAPATTPPAWTSITTGKNPGKHGIFGFFKVDENYNRSFYHSTDKRSKEIWDYLDYSIVANLPVSYPPKKINGAVVTGMFTPDIEKKFTYPEALKEEILSRFPNYKMELEWYKYENNLNEFLHDLYGMTDERIKLLYYFFSKKEWDLLFFVFIEPDRVQHLIWDNKKEVEKFYEYLDKSLAGIIEDATKKNIYVVFVSDHGFQKLEKMININSFLEGKGYVKIREDAFLNKKIITAENINKLFTKLRLRRIVRKIPSRIKKYVPSTGKKIEWKETKVFLVDYTGQLYVNRKTFFSEGIIEDGEEYEELRNKVIKDLKSLKDPETEHEVIKEIYKKEEIYSGDFLDIAPDLIVIPGEGYTFSTNLRDRIIERAGVEKACHDIFGILLINGPKIKQNYEIKGACVVDIAPTILHILDKSIPKDMDGRVLKEIFEDGSKLAKSEVKYQEVDERGNIKEKIREMRNIGKI
jgi:predicted AlkP superfamily phosphohydrolase/phosphomutase